MLYVFVVIDHGTRRLTVGNKVCRADAAEIAETRAEK